MSFLSRLFRKAPAPTTAPVSSRPSAPVSKHDPALPKPGAAERALASAAEESALQTAINAQDLPAISKLVIAGSSTKVRQAAAHAIQDPDVLRQLIREVRGGNDKSVYKILTTTRDRLLDEARKFEQLQAEIAAAASVLERHSQRPFDALYRSSLEQFERRWDAVSAQAAPELRGRVQDWIERSRETVAEHLREAAAQAAREQAAAEAAAEAEHVRQQQFEAASAVVTEPESEVAVPKAELSEQQQAEQQAVRQLAGLIRKASAALSDGSTARAASVRQTIEEKLAGVQPLRASLVSQIQQLDKRLAELQDWKTFSVTPKRAELIQEMELLIGATFEPFALAEKIKRLRDEWRTLGKGVAKGSDENLDADWQRFNDAARKAYEPCSEYFAAQALVRADNLRQRGEVLAGLMAFEAGQNWDQPSDLIDWRAVIKVLRDAKEAWRQHAAVDRQAGKVQQDQFSALITSLQGRLEAEYARNVKLKESLVERAQALLASDDGRKAIDMIKDLQQKWRAVGPVPREVDQRLWSDFRQHCDAVFERRQQESAAYTAGLEHNKTQAIGLCEALEKIATLDGPALLAGTNKLAELRTAFEALGEFPRADSRELRSRFDRALERCEAAIDRQRARDSERSWIDLFEAANHVRAYQLANVRGLDAEQVNTLKAAAEASIASIPRWPRNGLDVVKQNLARQPSNDLSANEAALRLLCIQAEILSDLPTPPEDQALRREYQLNRLVQSMGQGVKADATHVDTLAIEWVGVGPVEDAAYQSLRQRFLSCRERRYAAVASR